MDLKKEGKIRHLGISFHDKAEVLDQILREYPQVELVQIQLNYVDYEDASIDAKRVYEVCLQHDKPVVVMEPVKGGTLVNLPEDAQRVFDDFQKDRDVTYSNAAFAIRFAADFPQVRMILSGMSNLEQMEDNLSCMTEFCPLTGEEKKVIGRVCELFRSKKFIPCTSCHYCTEENKCPKEILISDMFSLMNTRKQFASWNQDYYYKTVITADGHAKAKDCIKCGSCEKVCPQQLPIRELLDQVAAEFDKKNK